jgi:hypothetical protein
LGNIDQRLQDTEEVFALVKRSGGNRRFDDEKNVSVLDQRLEKAGADKLDKATLADIPMDARKKEARKPLFLTRYE